MKKRSKQSPNSLKEVSPDIVYQEMYQELRRCRDYELTASTWYTTILLAMVGAVFTARFSLSGSSISLLLLSSCLAKLSISFLAGFIAFSGIYSVWYVRSRYSEMRRYVTDYLEPSWKDFAPGKKALTPYKLIVTNQILLVGLIVLTIWFDANNCMIIMPGMKDADYMSDAQMQTILLGVVTGVATAAVLGMIGWAWRQGREWRVRQLGDLMGMIIEHRNAGRRPVPDSDAWVQRAKELEQEAEQRASKVSSASGLLIHWLGEFPKFEVDAKVKDRRQKHYVSLLTAVISRIRDTLGRHDR